MALGLARETRRLQADIASDIEYREYSQEQLEDEPVGTLNANALVGLVQDRFSWNFRGDLSQGQQDPLAARGPGNRESITEVAHGPRLAVPFGRTTLSMAATRSARRFDESTEVESDTNAYEVGLSRQVRPTAVFSFVAGSGDTEFVDEATRPYRIDRAFLRVAKAMRRGTLSAELGRNEISSSDQSQRAPLLNLSWSRAISSRSTLNVTAVQGYTDPGISLGASGSALVTADPFERKGFALGYERNGEHATAAISLSSGEEDYAGVSALDNEYDVASILVEYRVSARVNVGARYERYKRRFETSLAFVSNTQADDSAALWFSRTVGQRFGLSLDLSRYGSTAAQAVDETRAELRVIYSPTGSTALVARSTGR